MAGTGSLVVWRVRQRPQLTTCPPPGHHLLGQEEDRISHNTEMMKKQMENTGLRFPCFV